MSFEKYMHHITTFPKVHFHQSSNFLHTPLCGQPLSTTLHSCHFYHHRLVLLALQPHINGTISVCILQCLAYFTQHVTEINLCCVSEVHYFLNEWIVFHCMDITVYLSIYLLMFQFEAIMTKDAMNINVQVFLWTYVFISLGWIPIWEIAGSHAKFMFNCIRNCQPAFQSGCTILQFHQQCESSNCFIFILTLIINL